MDNNFHPEQVGAVLPESQPRPPKECFSLNREVVPETDLWLCGLSCDFCSAVCCFQQTVQWKRRRSRVSKPAIQEDLEEGLAVWILVSYWSVDIPFFHLISMELRWESSSQEWLKFMKPTGYQCVNVKKNYISLTHRDRELTSASSLPQSHNNSSWAGDKAWSWELNLDLSDVWQESIEPLLLIPRVCISRRLESGARAGDWTQSLCCGTQAS